MTAAARPHVRAVPGPTSARGRWPAHDQDAERVLAATVLVEPEAVDRIVDLVQPEHLFGLECRTVLGAAYALHAAGAPGGLPEVVAYLRERGELAAAGGTQTLARLAAETPATVHLEHHARRVRMRARVREVSEAAQRIVAESTGLIADPQEWLDQAEASIAAIARSDEGESGLVTMRDALTEVFTEMTEADQRGGMLGVPTGFREHDARTGGLHPGELTILAARPGMGKTAIAMEMALNVSAYRREDEPENVVLFFSMEMPRSALVTRTICTAARVNVERLRTGTLQPDDWGRLTVAASWMAQRSILFDERRGLSPVQVRAKARRVQLDEARKGRKLALIVVDYLQLARAMALLEGNPTREREVAFIAESLKSLATELKIPILALAQLKREVDRCKDKRPTLSDLRESGGIEMTADSVIFLHREEYYLKDQCPPDLRGQAELIRAKERNGGQGKSWTRFYSDCGLFAD